MYFMNIIIQQINKIIYFDLEKCIFILLIIYSTYVLYFIIFFTWILLLLFILFNFIRLYFSYYYLNKEM